MKLNYEFFIINYVQNNIDAAIIKHATPTYGDFLSPILASFQNIPSILQKKFTCKISWNIKISTAVECCCELNLPSFITIDNWREKRSETY